MALRTFLAPPYDGNFSDMHALVACAMLDPAAARTDANYTWFRIYSCCNGHVQRSVEECSADKPAEFVEPLKVCMKKRETPTLIAAMHAIAETYRDFPTVLINGAPDPAVPEPDTHGDDVQPLIQEVCRLAGASGATLPPACA